MRSLRVAVVGLGLIGGSLARALRTAGHQVRGIDRPGVLRAASRARAIERGVSLEQAADWADVLVLAAPPRANERLLRRLARLGPARLVVTDVSSVKQPIVAEARRLALRRFVGGHPIAGSERSGFGASRAGLFAGAAWVLTPTAETEAGALRLVRRLARAAGARPIVLDAARHDRALAFLSHLPQLVAWALAGAVRADAVARAELRLAGPAWRDMTRLCRSPARLWAQILAANRIEVVRAVRALRAELGAGARAVAARGKAERSAIVSASGTTRRRR
ncbi:MAG: prephenate dehydrogenase [Vicinamibacteria bacterium]